MNALGRCPACGAALPPNRLSGLCPACTWKGLSDYEEDEAPITSGFLPGSLMRVPGYELNDEIARGGMGIVYRAQQLDPPRTVALKMLLPHQLGATEAKDEVVGGHPHRRPVMPPGLLRRQSRHGPEHFF